MPLPSLYSFGDHDRAWSVPRAAGYGAGIGALAAAFKVLGAARLAGAGGIFGGHVGGVTQIALAALAFALLCAVAAALRNFLARHFVGREDL